MTTFGRLLSSLSGIVDGERQVVMAQVTIDVPEGLSTDEAVRVATEALAARATSGRIGEVLARSDLPVGPGLLAQAALHDDAWRRIADEYGLLSADEVTLLTGGNRDRATSHTSNLRLRKRLAGVKRGGRTLYPGFQFTDPDAGPADVAPAWTALVEALAPAQWPPADILMWAAAPNSWLDGTRPADEIRKHPTEPTELLLLAAEKAVPSGVRGTHAG
jgi:hypothetical protein